MANELLVDSISLKNFSGEVKLLDGTFKKEPTGYSLTGTVIIRSPHLQIIAYSKETIYLNGANHIGKTQDEEQDELFTLEDGHISYG